MRHKNPAKSTTVRILDPQYAEFRELVWQSRGTMSINGLMQEAAQNWIDDVLPVRREELEKTNKAILAARRRKRGRHPEPPPDKK